MANRYANTGFNDDAQDMDNLNSLVDYIEDSGLDVDKRDLPYASRFMTKVENKAYAQYEAEECFEE